MTCYFFRPQPLAVLESLVGASEATGCCWGDGELNMLNHPGPEANSTFRNNALSCSSTTTRPCAGTPQLHRTWQGLGVFLRRSQWHVARMARHGSWDLFIRHPTPVTEGLVPLNPIEAG